MDIRRLTTAQDLERYSTWIQSNPQGSLWQSVEWKRYQESLKRQTRIYVADENGQIHASALVVIDTTVGGLSTWEIPRGPVGVISDQKAVISLLETVVSDAKRDRCLSLFLSPATQLPTNHYPLTTRHVYPEATITLDLTQTDEALLAQMHEKGRYNIRLAEKKGVTVEQSADTHAFFQLVRRTAARDGFTHPSERTYEAFRSVLPNAFLLLAYAPNHSEPIAGLLGVIWNGTGIYYYGASDHDHRALQAPSLLQWHAMQLCKQLGCRTYDLFGIAPPVVSDQRSEGSNNDESTFDIRYSTFDTQHPWATVTDFKRKLGGTVITYPPEQELVLRPMTKAFLEWKRRIIG